MDAASERRNYRVISFVKKLPEQTWSKLVHLLERHFEQPTLNFNRDEQTVQCEHTAQQRSDHWNRVQERKSNGAQKENTNRSQKKCPNVLFSPVMNNKLHSCFCLTKVNTSTAEIFVFVVVLIFSLCRGKTLTGDRVFIFSQKRSCLRRTENGARGW